MVGPDDSPALFSSLSELVEERTGLHYGWPEREKFFERVIGRATEAGFSSLLHYYYFLRYDPRGSEEMRALTDLLVVNESYFFREIEALRVVVKSLQALVKAGVRPRVWCAACATGEEALTLAMLLADAGLLADVDIVASDISTSVLGSARAGRFNPRAVREGFDVGLVERWLRRVDGGQWQIEQTLVDAISWSRVNLCDATAVAAVGAFDVILCRNVLIYFRAETVSRVLASLAGALTRDGALFVGVSESLVRFGTGLVSEERERAFCYRRCA